MNLNITINSDDSSGYGSIGRRLTVYDLFDSDDTDEDDFESDSQMGADSENDSRSFTFGSTSSSQRTKHQREQLRKEQL